MEAILITARGAESAAKKEVEELISPSTISFEDSVVAFKVKEPLDLGVLCYRSQSAQKILHLLCRFDVSKDIEATKASLKKNLKGIDIKQYFPGKQTHTTECERLGEHDFNSVEMATNTGILLKDVMSGEKIVSELDYDTPDIVFYVFVNGDKGYLGIDYSGTDLSKRQYKIFNHPESLKSTTAYVLLREADYKKSMTLIDPFMGSGIIVIEAALFALDFPVNYYSKKDLLFTNFSFFEKDLFKKIDAKIVDEETSIFGYDSQLRYLTAAKKNAKLAGIEKNISLSKISVEWLDTKFEKKSVDLIISDPPRLSKTRDNKEIIKVFDELFYQADYIIKKTGKVVLLSKHKEELEGSAKKHNFIIKKESKIYQGKEIFSILTFVRG